MRFRPVGTNAAQREPPAIGGCELRPLNDSHFVRCKSWHVVEPIDGVAWEEVEQPVLHHALRATAGLLRGLEDEMRHSGKSTRCGKMTGRAQEHGCMSVVPAGMHLALRRRPISAVGRLEHGQRVHIGAHPDGSRAVSDTQCSHDASAAETAVHLEPSLFQDRRHDIASPHLLESKLGMRVKIPPQLGEEMQIGRDLF
jgi:hypothetical protein